MRYVLVVILGGGPLEDVRVYGPWRSHAKAPAAHDRLARALDSLGEHELAEFSAAPVFDVVELSPEYGVRSLSELLEWLRYRARELRR